MTYTQVEYVCKECGQTISEDYFVCGDGCRYDFEPLSARPKETIKKRTLQVTATLISEEDLT